MRRLLLAAVLVPALAQAQPDDRSQLPSLTPAVFESRGVIAVTLPVVERQPLSGFGPLPRRYVVPAEREPVTQPFDPDLDALPALALAPPPEPPATDLDVRNLRAEAGAGAYLARYGRLDLSAGGAAGEFFVDAAYDGFPETDGRIASDRVEVRAGGQSFGPGRVRLEGYGLFDAYTTPGLGFSRRMRQMAGAELGLETVGSVPAAVTVGFEQGRLTRADDSETTTEGRVDAAARVALFQQSLLADLAGGTAGSGSVGTDVQYGAAGIALSLAGADGLRLTLGARALVYDASATAGAGDAQAIGPIVDVRLPLGPAASAFAVNDPHLAVRSLTDLTGDNPYVVAAPIVAPDVVPVDARAGLELRSAVARARVFGTAFVAPTFLAFEEFSGGFDAVYLDARSYGIGADLALVLPLGATASAGVEVRSGRAEGGEIPFFAPLVGRAGVQVPFASGRGRVGLAADAESARPTDRLGDLEAAAFGRLSLDARYALTGPLAVVLRGERLLGEAERWPGFPEPPFTVLLGVRLAR
ncbi:hypothetical protein [Rubrivirga sp.]|uniref:hypothetical protein n=1 Tax=Rubrivirga sp. TaxID=1885344 RepID=UPI003B528369